jgi:hypothetical protein
VPKLSDAFRLARLLASTLSRSLFATVGKGEHLEVYPSEPQSMPCHIGAVDAHDESQPIASTLSSLPLLLIDVRSELVRQADVTGSDRRARTSCL